MDCGRSYGVAEYREEIDEETWELIARRPSNRA
jgi:hypothetical protein